MKLLEKLKEHALMQPAKTALTGSDIKLDYRSLLDEVEQVAAKLREMDLPVIGLYADNCPAWVIMDLASLSTKTCLVPLPRFFAAGQMLHAMRQTRMAAVITDAPGELRARLGDQLLPHAETIEVAGSCLSIIFTAFDRKHKRDVIVFAIQIYGNGSRGGLAVQ